MKLHSQHGPQEGHFPDGSPFVTDDNDDVEVSDAALEADPDLAAFVAGLVEQTAKWVPADRAARELAESRYDDLRKSALLAEAEARGLDPAGTVDELRARLIAADKADASAGGN